MANRNKTLAALVAALIIATPILYAHTTKVWAISAARVTKEKTIVPYIKAVIQFNYTKTTISAASGDIATTVITRTYIVGIGEQAYVVPLSTLRIASITSRSTWDSYLKTFTIQDLQRAGDVVPAATEQKTFTIENHTHGANTDTWSVDDLTSSTTQKWYDNNGNGYKADSTGVIISSIDLALSSGVYYYIELYDLETNSTNANSVVYIGWENSTDTTKIVYDSGHVNQIYRKSIKLYYFYVNTSARPTGTNAKIKSIKLVNLNCKKVEIVSRNALLEDTRSLSISIGSATVSGFHVAGWFNDFYTNALTIPNFNLEDSYTDLTDAWGWTSLHDIVVDIGESLADTGETFQDYSVQAYDLVMQTGEDLGNQVLNVLNDVAEGTTATIDDTVEALDQVKDDIIHSVTLAVDIPAEALEDGMASAVSAADNVIDLTHAAIATISQSVSGAVEWTVDSVNGLIETATSGAQHFIDGTVGLFNSISNWFSQWWWAILLFGALVFFIIILAISHMIKVREVNVDAV